MGFSRPYTRLQEFAVPAGVVALGINSDKKHGVNLRTQVTLIKPLGAHKRVFAQVGENKLRTVVGADAKIKIGDKIAINFSPKDVFLFDARNGGLV